MSEVVASGEILAAQEHHKWFREFIRLETAVGGPDPHLATLGAMIAPHPWAERVWRCGLYALGYNVPTAEVVWLRWPTAQSVLDNQDEFGAWIEEHWPSGFGLRRERRAVRTAAKFTRCAISIAEWTDWTTSGEPRWWRSGGGARAFEEAWRSVGEIYGLGRYVMLKFVEALHRYAGGEFAQHDIRASGGQSPREGLALLFPGARSWLLASNAGMVTSTERLAAQLRADVSRDLGQEVDFFTLQVVLCEYKKVFLGRQYPGRTHDTEIRYYDAMCEAWQGAAVPYGDVSGFLDARAAVFDSVCLGEKRGWRRQREELEPTLPDYGYMWSDTIYDYVATTDPANPVPWS